MGKPASRVGDAHACPQYDGDDPHIGGPVLEGCASVLIGNGNPPIFSSGQK